MKARTSREEGTFAFAIAPDSSATVKSVNVPPVSMLRRYIAASSRPAHSLGVPDPGCSTNSVNTPLVADGSMNAVREPLAPGCGGSPSRGTPAARSLAISSRMSPTSMAM